MSQSEMWPSRVRSTFYTRNGEKLTMRLIKAGDAALLEQLFYQLSPQSRWRRFHSITDNVPPEEVSRSAQEMANVDNRTDEGAVVAISRKGDKREIVGVVRLARPPGAPTSPEAEVAVVVRDDYHGQGIGGELLRRMVLLARRMKVRKIVAVFQPDNDVAIRLFRGLGLPYKMVTASGTSKMYLDAPN